MTRSVRLGLFAVSGAVLGALLVWAFTGLPDFGRFNGEYGWILDDVAGHERHVTNVVSAVVVEEDWTQPGINALLIAVALFFVSPVLAHATARAARARRR